jgi:ribose-phosphate pyrophosphokinase
MLNHPPVRIFSTTGSRILAGRIYDNLKARLPNATLGNVDVAWFANQNPQIQISDVRDCLAVVIHTQSPPVSDGTIELLALLDAISNASPADVLLVFPYMPYGRSDRKNKSRISVMGCRLPKILNQSFGIKRVILLDPHDTHIKHYFDPAADEVTAMYLMIDYLKAYKGKKRTTVVFGDNGAITRYDKIAFSLDLPSAYIEKRRLGDDDKSEVKRIVGDVSGQDCIIADDEMLTGGTVSGDINALLGGGAQKVTDVIAIHPVLMSKEFSENELISTLLGLPVDHFVFTDSIPHCLETMGCSSKIRVLSIAPLLAEAIKRSAVGQSLTELHQLESVDLYRL